MVDDLTTIDGVGKMTAQRLEQEHYTTIMAIAIASPKDLSEKIEGLSLDGAIKIINSAKELAEVGDFITSAELKERRKNLRHLLTGSNQLDELFLRKEDDIVTKGLETTTITEFFGEYGSGKTQICFQLAVNATMPESEGGLDGHVIYIDTENTFRPNRIDDIARAQGLDLKEINEKIHTTKAFNAAHQMLLIEQKAYELAKKVPVKLVIVDSLVAHFRSEYIGRGNLGERQQMLNKHMHELLRFADLNNAVIAVTNQVMANPAQLFGDPTKPVGGHIVGHTSTYRVYLKKGKAGKSTARMIDSPEHPINEAIIALTKEGIRDG
jgi:DNA repair protein RadA